MGLLQVVCAAFVFSSVAFTDFDLMPIDAVLVLDVSRSMQAADPDRISRDAMNMFVDMLAEGRDAVGVVAYAGRVERSRDMTVVYGAERDELRDFINGLEYASWTDHGLGLLEAVRILQNGHDIYRQPVIIFLTDGNLNPNPNEVRTFQEAEDDIALAVRISREYGFPIYTIGLNFDGSLDRAAVDYIADATGGISFETADAEDLPWIIDAIFSMMVPIPRVVLEELPPEIPPEPVVIIEEPTAVYVTYEIIYEIDYDAGEAHLRRVPFFGGAVGFVAFFLILCKFNRGKRVFTGIMVVDVTVKNALQTTVRRNLIEYGGKVTLLSLVGGGDYDGLDTVIITPSPTAPSHLPQVVVKCKNPRVKIVKDFVAHSAVDGLVLSPGGEIVVVLEEDGVEVRLGYL